MRKGKALQVGDTIGLTAPSSPATPEVLAKAQSDLEALGFQVKVGESCRQTYGGYLAGHPQLRAEEINCMFADPEVDAIMCLRGGYGTPQLLPLLDYDCIAANPKLFIGYSDITALHTVFMQEAGLATLHGPMASAGIASEQDPWSRDYLLRAMTCPDPLGEIINPEGQAAVSGGRGRRAVPYRQNADAIGACRNLRGLRRNHYRYVGKLRSEKTGRLFRSRCLQKYRRALSEADDLEFTGRARRLQYRFAIRRTGAIGCGCVQTGDRRGCDEMTLDHPFWKV